MTSEELSKIERFSIFAKAAASLSKDNTQIGAAILGPNFEVRSIGYNGFPRGVNDDIRERHERPLKYKYSEHAERNAIYNAARVGTPIDGCQMVLFGPICSCTDCTRAMIQVGIKRLIWCVKDGYDPTYNKWTEEEVISRQMMEEAGVEIILISTNLEVIEVDPFSSYES